MSSIYAAIQCGNVANHNLTQYIVESRVNSPILPRPKYNIPDSNHVMDIQDVIELTIYEDTYDRSEDRIPYNEVTRILFDEDKVAETIIELCETFTMVDPETKEEKRVFTEAQQQKLIDNKDYRGNFYEPELYALELSEKDRWRFCIKRYKAKLSWTKAKSGDKVYSPTIKAAKS